MANSKQIIDRSHDFGAAAQLVGLAITGVCAAAHYFNRKWVHADQYQNRQTQQSPTRSTQDVTHLPKTGTDS